MFKLIQSEPYYVEFTPLFETVKEAFYSAIKIANSKCFKIFDENYDVVYVPELIKRYNDEIKYSHTACRKRI